MSRNYKDILRIIEVLLRQAQIFPLNMYFYQHNTNLIPCHAICHNTHTDGHIRDPSTTPFSTRLRNKTPKPNTGLHN